MKWRRRFRKTVKWGGVVAIVPMARAAVVGYWYQWTLRFNSASTIYVIGVGNAAIGHTQVDAKLLNLLQDLPPSTLEASWSWKPPNDRKVVWLPYLGESSTPKHIIVPLWIPMLLVAAPTAFAWRRDALARRRDRVGLCQKCGYDRAGITSGSPCPECGSTPVEKATP